MPIFKAMRVFIAFILWSIFYASAAFAAEHGSVALTYKTVKKSNVQLRGSSTFSKKEMHRLSKEPISASAERIHRTTGSQPLAIAINDISDWHNAVPNPDLTVKLVGYHANHSYLFIFNCLYPNHSFW